MLRPSLRPLNSFNCSSSNTLNRCDSCVRMTHCHCTVVSIEALPLPTPASQTIPTLSTSSKDNINNTIMNVIVIVIGAPSTHPRPLVRPLQTRRCRRRLVIALLLLPQTPLLPPRFHAPIRIKTTAGITTLPPTPVATTLSQYYRQELRACPTVPPSCHGP